MSVLLKPGIPVSVLTGFLGSGKTTVLNHVLKHPGMAGTAVIVNEFGDVGIDHLLVETSFEDAVLLNSGCICCTVRGDLVDTLDLLRIRRERGEIPAYDRVAIETTGLADPTPVLQTLMSDPAVIRHYRMNGLTATVDAVNGLAQLDRYPEAVKQAALAGHLLLTKVDIATPQAVAPLADRLARLNPSAIVTRVAQGRVGPEAIFADDQYDPAAAGRDAAEWLGAAAFAVDREGETGHHHAHGEDITAFCLEREAPIAWSALRTWLASVTSLRGADLLRIKGIVNIAGSDVPMIVHGVQHVFHAPVRLARWPDDDRRTRIVCITRGIGKSELANALEAAADSVIRKEG